MHSTSTSQPRYEKRSKPINCSCETHEAQLPVFDCLYHFHPEIELLAIHNSHGICLIDGQLERFQAGDVFFISSNSPHSFTNRRRDSRSPDWARYSVAHFLPNFLGDSTSFLPELVSIRKLLNEPRSRVLKGQLRQYVAGRMREVNVVPKSHKVLIIIDILQRIIDNFEQTQFLDSSERMPLHSYDAERLARVYRFINDHSTEPLNLEDVAACASMAPSSFSRFFHKKTGKTFQVHLTEVRILDACSRLVLTDVSVTRICYESGFSNLSNFNRHFKRYKDCTPTDFRKNWELAESEQQRVCDPTKQTIDFENKDFRATAYD
jgi:AraC-like DNA-binding protein